VEKVWAGWDAHAKEHGGFDPDWQLVIERLVAAHTVEVEEPVTDAEIVRAWHEWADREQEACYPFEDGYRAGAARRGRG